MCSALEQMRQRAEIVRSKIDHEDALRHNRMLLFVLIEGLLYTALGRFLESKLPFVVLLCLIGMSVSLSFIYVFALGENAMRTLKCGYEKFCKDLGVLPKEQEPVIGIAHDQLTCEEHPEVLCLWRVLHFLVPWILLPYVFLLSWAVFLLLKVLS